MDDDLEDQEDGGEAQTLWDTSMLLHGSEEILGEVG